ncbi:MAG: hypothetical protein ACRC68_12145 [Clostridium sp.]
MANYLKNKNFIPRKYIKNQDFMNNKGSKRGLIILMVVNLLVLPITVDTLFKDREVIALEVPKVVDEGIPIGSAIKWIEEVDSDVLSINIKNNSGTMIVKSMGKIYRLEESDGIVINNVNSTDISNYNVQLTRNN